MHRFFDAIIRPIIEIAQPRSIVEIGVADGAHTKKIIAAFPKITLHCIDTERRINLSHPNLTFYETTSLEALPLIESVDLALIDGDHNWYTVTHELRLLSAKKYQPIILLHDVSWPYDRRDMYYDAEQIPAIFRHPHVRRGIDPETNLLTRIGGFNPHVDHAAHAGGPRNGVLTAIEDFLHESGPDYRLTLIPGHYGLGILTQESHLQKYPVLRAFLAPSEQISGDESVWEKEALQLRLKA